MLIHEQKKDGAPVFVLFRHPDLNWPRNFNRYFECVVCDEGQICVEIDEISHILNPGEAALIFPYTFYQYKTIGHCVVRIIIFGSSHTMAFVQKTQFALPESFRFVPSGIWMAMLDEICVMPKCSEFAVNGLFYRMCDEFLGQNQLTRKRYNNDDKWVRLFSYLQNNFTENITLAQVALHIGYDYYYLSKRILETTGMSFTRLLSKYRVEYAVHLLSDNTMSISQIALKCGFGSIRNFNRQFKEITGVTPRAYAGQQEADVLYR